MRRRRPALVDRCSTTGWSSGTRAGHGRLAELVPGEAGCSLRPDQQRDGSGELREVEPELEVARGDVAVTGIEQHDRLLAGAGQQDVVGGQRAVRHPVPVELEYRVEHPAELVIGGSGMLGEGGSLRMIGGDGRRLRPDAQGRAQPRGRHAGVLHGVGHQRASLDRPTHRHRRAAGRLAGQPQPTVDPVEGVGGLLVPVEHHHVETLAVRAERGVPAVIRPAVRDPAYLHDRHRRHAQRRGDLASGRPLGVGADQVAQT